jgi:hypothetical protein
MADFGKWSHAGVPKKGWTCIGETVLDGQDEICQMCERQEIRFVHHMWHPNYGELDCGCDCAARMEEDYTAATRRDKNMKASVRRRKTWPKLKAWRTSRNGNPTIEFEGFRVTIFQSGGWTGMVSNATTELKHRLKQYPSVDAAKLAAFDTIRFVKNRAMT